MDTYYGCHLITYQKYFTALDGGAAEAERVEKGRDKVTKAGIKRAWTMQEKWEIGSERLIERASMHLWGEFE